MINNHNIIRSNKNGHIYRYFNPYPWIHDSLCQSDHALRIGQVNIRSLIQHYDELNMLPINTFDILCINETWLNRNHLNQSIELMFFADPLRHDRIDVCNYQFLKIYLLVQLTARGPVSKLLARPWSLEQFINHPL